MRFAPDENTISLARPFEGQGVSLYAQVGTPIQYNLCSAVSGCILRGAERDIGADVSNPKTTRVASGQSPLTELSASDPSWVGQDVATNIRTFKDDVENESLDSQTISLDGSGDGQNAILGTAILLDTEQRDGGIVRIRFTWIPADTGLQPDTFTAIRTAGPTSPLDVSVTARSGYQLIEIDTPALSDASAYTYKIQASAEMTTLDILTGITVQADATGPTAPTVTAREW